MDFVKRENHNVVDDENYKAYMENLQKSHQIDTVEYQHTPISMEQLHQAMSLNASSIVHNFQLPLSPRQMSTLMLKTNQLSRINEIPAHLPRNIVTDIDLTHHLIADVQNLRHEDLILNQTLNRVDMTLARTLGNELELHNGLAQSLINDQDLTRNLNNDIAIPQTLRSEIPHDLNHEIDLSHHLNRNIDQDIISQDERRTPIVQCGQDVDAISQQALIQRLEQNLGQRLEQNLGQRMEQNLGQRLEERLDQRLVNSNLLHDGQRPLGQAESLMPMAFHIKAEQEDDGYFYDNINQGISNVNEVNGHLPAEQTQTNIHQDNQMYSIYNNHVVNFPALNAVDMYSRTQNYVQNFVNNRENPQNLVMHRQFENNSPYTEEFKKLREENGGKSDSLKNEQPKENLKPNDQNKIFFAEYNSNFSNEVKNENDSGVQNKLSDDLTMNIKGEYVCYKCNEVFPSKRGLKQHGKSCTDKGENDVMTEKIGKFGCSQCAYKCQSPAILKIHERTHSGEKPFSCTFCDYKSGQKNNVAKHILVHMKEKPFRCQFCEYRCAQKNNLVVHERTHTGYKPFACPYCDYRTVQKPNLVKHMYLHTDQKPFSCDMCSYKCVQKTNLTKHKQRHVNEKGGEKVEVRNQTKPYKPRQKSVKCPHCSYKCVQKSSLEKHMQFKHNGVVEEFSQEYDQSLMKENETIQNLSVKKNEVYVCQDKMLEPLQVQS